MRKFSFKSFVSGILIGCLVMIGSVGFAAGVSKTIKVVMNAVSVKIDGKVLNGEKISYNGNTFVNVKSVADVLGKSAVTDKSGNVSLASKDPMQSFKTKASEFMSKQKNGFEITKLTDGKWANMVYKTELISIDCVKSKSLLSPYVGVIKYNVYNGISNDEYDTKEEVQPDSDLKADVCWKYTQYFNYLDGNWIIGKQDVVLE